MALRTALALSVAALLALTACGSTEEAAEPPSAAATTTGASPAGGGTVLLASVGTEDEPESFEIALTTQDGRDVESLPAGDYTIQVRDQSRIHNFAVFGPGVEERTGVSEREDAVFEVTLTAGGYDYVCDPHVDSMSGSFTVT